MTWNYRVFKTKQPDGSYSYGIHEAYYDDAQDIPHSWTVTPVPVDADSVEDLREVISRMLSSCDHACLQNTDAGDKTDERRDAPMPGGDSQRYDDTCAPNHDVLKRYLHTKPASAILRALHITNDMECSTATALLEQFAHSADPAINPFINLLADAIEAYEQKHHAIPTAPPVNMAILRKETRKGWAKGARELSELEGPSDAGERVPIDAFHYHEALDRTHLICQMLADHLVDHAAIVAHNHLKERCQQVLEDIAGLYQDIGKAADHAETILREGHATPSHGSTIDSWLEEEGIKEHCNQISAQRVRDWVMTLSPVDRNLLLDALDLPPHQQKSGEET